MDSEAQPGNLNEYIIDICFRQTSDSLRYKEMRPTKSMELFVAWIYISLDFFLNSQVPTSRGSILPSHSPNEQIKKSPDKFREHLKICLGSELNS